MPNKQYILAIDQGTTSSRAIIYHKGKVVDFSQIEISQITPKNGWIEQNPEEIFESVYQTIKNVLNNAKIKLSDIKAIGIANQRETTVLWDKITGKAVYNAIVWQSRQSQSICEVWIDQGLADLVKTKTGLMINPYFSASKIKWILNNVKGVYERAKRGEIAFGTIDSYLVWRLTEKVCHVTDYSNASRTMVFNIKNHTWDEELLTIMDIPKAIFPKVVNSSGIIGPATYLNNLEKEANVLITSIIGDQQGALFGQCCFEKGAIKNTYGTGCFMLMNTLDECVESKKGLLTTIAWSIDGHVEYALEGSVFIAGAAVQWLRDGLRFFEKSGECENYAKKCGSSNGVYMVPAFVGLGTPYWDNDVRGAILGLTSQTTKDNIIAAALEGIAYQAKDVMDVMKEEAHLDISYLAVDGGASCNNYLMQFQADLLDVKLIRPENLETTALGAVYLAGLAIGEFKSKDEIKMKMKVDQLFMSQITEEERRKKMLGWRKAIRSIMAFK